MALLKRLSPRYRVANLSEVRPLDRPDVSFESADGVVMEAVYWFGTGGYEGMLADLWQQLCAGRHSILEIGANVGLYTVLGARAAPQADYVAVEPVPAIAQVLRHNLRRNHISNVKVVEAAVVPGDETSVTMNIPDRHRAAPTGAQVLAGTEAPHKFGENLVVTARNFAGLVRQCDLIKMDAEGLEATLLESAWTEIALRRPAIVVEVLPRAARLGTLLVRLAQEVGYEISVVPAWGSDQLVPVRPEDFSAAIPSKHRSKDVLLTPN